MPFGISFFIPPLRHFVTPLLKERLFIRLQLRGAVNAVDCGVACSYFHMTVIFYRIIFHHSITSWHLSSRRGFCTAPIEGEPATQWLWGGLFAFSYDYNFLSYRFPPLRHFVTPLLKERLLYGSHWGELSTQLTVGWLVYIFIWLSFFILSFSTTPSLRDTSPQGEAFVRLLLRGAGNAGFYAYLSTKKRDYRG